MHAPFKITRLELRLMNAASAPSGLSHSDLNVFFKRQNNKSKYLGSTSSVAGH